MKRFVLVAAALLIALSPVALMAQDRVVTDDFNSLGSWTPGAGDWEAGSGRLTQQDAAENLARVDRPVPQSGEVEISFDVRYEAGGIPSSRPGEFHGGFGIHLGVEAAPGETTWGAGDSYLLWLNLDTRRGTRADRPQHLGIRAQVYRSETDTLMELSRLNVDIQAELANIGVNFNVDSLTPYLDEWVPMRIRVNYDTGDIMVNDPSAPSIWFTFTLDPEILAGRYVALRTNRLSLSFRDFTVTRL